MNEYKKSIALGTFDGFHLGHQKVIELSKKSGYMPYVLLFSVHPLKCIKGEAPPEILTDGLRKSFGNRFFGNNAPVSRKLCA